MTTDNIQAIVDVLVDFAQNATDGMTDADRTFVADTYRKVHVARSGQIVSKFTIAAIGAGVDTTVISDICDIMADSSQFATNATRKTETDNAVNMGILLTTAMLLVSVIEDEAFGKDVSDDDVEKAQKVRDALLAGMGDTAQNDAIIASVANARKALNGPKGTKTRYTDTMANLLERGDVVIGDVLVDKAGNALIVAKHDEYVVCDESGDPTETVFKNVSSAAGHFTHHETNGWIHWMKDNVLIGDLRVN